MVIPLLSHNHVARFISGSGQLFPAVSNFQGTLLVQCSAPIAALVLRQNTTPLSFTSLPAVSTSSAKRTLDLAQVANGSYGGGSYKTSFLIFNISASATNVILTLTDDNGNPLSVTIPGRGTNSSFSFPNLAPGASLFLQTDGTGNVATGAATITSTVPIGASAVFTVLNSQGAFQTETGVGDSPVLLSLTLPVDITGKFDTGVAFFAAGGSSSNLTFRLLDPAGASFGSSVTRSLPSNGHLAVFVSQIFSATSGFKGSLAVTASSGVAALTLRQNSAPLSYTTLPVVSGTSKGKTSSTAGRLLSKTEIGVNATANLTKDETLQGGFKLTGTVSGPGLAKNVLATTDSNASYSGTVNRQTGAYSVLLPAGSYTLKVGFTPNGVPSGQSVSVIHSVPGSIQVSADTTLDIALPLVTVFNVSGTVTGLNNLPLSVASVMESATNSPSPYAATSPPQIVFTSSVDPTASASFSVNAADSSYQGVLPSGTYTVGLSSSWITSGLQIQTLGLLNLGSASISGNTTLPPYPVPAMSKLSGTVHGLGVGPIGTSATLAALDLSVTVTGDSIADFTTGQYQMILPRNVTYNVFAAVPLMQGTKLLGSFAFPLVANSVSLGQDTANFDFTVPVPPVQVTISGHVTDSSGNPLGNVSVSAGSTSITGGQIYQYSGYGQTDATGFYSVVVLSGTDYTLSFFPLVQ